MREARRFYRRRVDLPAALSLAGRVPETCRIDNLSIDGAYIVVRPLPAAMALRLRFRIPGCAELFDVDATVSWSDDRGVGVHFHPLPSDQVWRLGHFLGVVGD